MYNSADTLMSKGLSVYQAAILELLKERGSMDILQLAQFFVTLQLRKKGDKDTAWSFAAVSEIAQPQAVYRLMRSLEKRGLVGRLMHRRPARWYYLTWEDEAPSISFGKDGREVFDYNYLMETRGRFEFTSKGEKWVISQT